MNTIRMVTSQMRTILKLPKGTWPIITIFLSTALALLRVMDTGKFSPHLKIRRSG
jgi:hypothetical protein